MVHMGGRHPATALEKATQANTRANRQTTFILYMFFNRRYRKTDYLSFYVNRTTPNYSSSQDVYLTACLNPMKPCRLAVGSLLAWFLFVFTERFISNPLLCSSNLTRRYAACVERCESPTSSFELLSFKYSIVSHWPIIIEGAIMSIL
jgi:hypothetical protein